MLLFQDSYFDNYWFHPWTAGICWCSINNFCHYEWPWYFHFSTINVWGEQYLCEFTGVHASGDQYLPQEAEPGPTTTAHPSFMPQDSRTRLTHCPHEWSQPSVVKCGYPMFKNWEVCSDFWNIPKDPRTSSLSLEILRLFLEINIPHLAPRDTAQRVCCPVPGVAFSEKSWIRLYFLSVILCLDKHPWTVWGGDVNRHSPLANSDNAHLTPPGPRDLLHILKHASNVHCPGFELVRLKWRHNTETIFYGIWFWGLSENKTRF